MEIKNIIGFDNYKITSDGDIIGIKGFKLKTQLWNGYPKICLRKNKIKFSKYVHHLVLETFVGPKLRDNQCNHKNGIKTDNRVENLEWVSRSKNIKHAFKKGLKLPNRKLKIGEVWLIKRLLDSKIVSYKRIAEMFRLHKSTIYEINRGFIWKET